MSLLLLVAMVVIGIAAIVFAVHMSGGSAVVPLDEGAARQRFGEDHPDITVERILLTADGLTAFLDSQAGLGVVHTLGHHRLTRLLRLADIASTERSGTEVRLTLRDFTWPGGRFTFASAAEAAEVEKLARTVAGEEASRWTTISSPR